MKNFLAKFPSGVRGLEVADLLTHGGALNQVLFAEEVSFCWSAEKIVGVTRLRVIQVAVERYHHALIKLPPHD